MDISRTLAARTMNLLLIPLIAVLLSSTAAGQPASSAGSTGFIVIVHASNPVATVDRDDLSRIFLKKVAKWPNGTAAEPIDLATSIASRVAFTEAVHRKSVGAVRAFWQQQIFSGRSVPPPEKRSDADVVLYVREHPGAVGYVSAGTTLQDGVKMLDIKGLAR